MFVKDIFYRHNIFLQKMKYFADCIRDVEYGTFKITYVNVKSGNIIFSQFNLICFYLKCTCERYIFIIKNYITNLLMAITLYQIFGM